MSAGAVAPGDKLPERRIVVTQAQIDRYAEASGDRNPLHLDADFAAQTLFGRRIAHGLLTLAFLSQAMTAWNWPGWGHGGSLDIAFLAPVYPGDAVVVSGEVTALEETDGARIAVCKVRCAVGSRIVLAGTTRCRLDGG